MMFRMSPRLFIAGLLGLQRYKRAVVCVGSAECWVRGRGEPRRSAPVCTARCGSSAFMRCSQLRTYFSSSLESPVWGGLRPQDARNEPSTPGSVVQIRAEPTGDTEAPLMFRFKVTP